MSEGTLTDAAVDFMRTSNPVPTNVDEYIARHSPDVQAILQQIRQLVGRAAPDAQEDARVSGAQARSVAAIQTCKFP